MFDISNLLSQLLLFSTNKVKTLLNLFNSFALHWSGHSWNSISDQSKFFAFTLVDSVLILSLVSGLTSLLTLSMVRNSYASLRKIVRQFFPRDKSQDQTFKNCGSAQQIVGLISTLSRPVLRNSYCLCIFAFLEIVHKANPKLSNTKSCKTISFWKSKIILTRYKTMSRWAKAKLSKMINQPKGF